ncbi:MAG: hypothetical protein ACHQ49_13270 [Elusimicrobiota bacterium]
MKLALSLELKPDDTSVQVQLTVALISFGAIDMARRSAACTLVWACARAEAVPCAVGMVVKGAARRT